MAEGTRKLPKNSSLHARPCMMLEELLLAGKKAAENAWNKPGKENKRERPLVSRKISKETGKSKGELAEAGNAAS